MTPDSPKFQQGSSAENIGSARSTWLQDKYDKGMISQEIITPANTLQSFKILAFGRVGIILENSENIKAIFEQTAYSASGFNIYRQNNPCGHIFQQGFFEEPSRFLGQVQCKH